MTLRQKKFLEELPKNNYNISKTAKKVGYSDNTSTSKIYDLVRNSKNIKEYFTEQTVKRDIKKVKRLVLQNKDYTNFIRATELESKILGLQVDKAEIKSTIINTPDEQSELNRLRGSILPSIN
jgi:hypothetical protein